MQREREKEREKEREGKVKKMREERVRESEGEREEIKRNMWTIRSLTNRKIQKGKEGAVDSQSPFPKLCEWQ